VKRVIAQYRLSMAKQFKIKLKEPGIIHDFDLDFEPAKVLTHGNQPTLVPFPFIRVELDPDGEEKERIFAVCINHEILEAPSMKYISSMRASENSVAHLFEIFEPAEPVTQEM
jgi:hypothetical protein